MALQTGRMVQAKKQGAKMKNTADTQKAWGMRVGIDWGWECREIGIWGDDREESDMRLKVSSWGVAQSDCLGRSFDENVKNRGWNVEWRVSRKAAVMETSWEFRPEPMRPWLKAVISKTDGKIQVWSMLWKDNC